MLQEKSSGTAESPVVSLMKNYAHYNLWANTMLVNWLRTKPVDLLEREIPSSFPSVRLTLIHIWQTQRYWLSILKKAAPQTYDEFNGTLEDVFTGFLEQSSALADHISSMTEADMMENILIESPWFQSDFQSFEYIMHCMNHSTYHRGQIITIGRNLGFTDAPMTDYNFYNVKGQ